MELLSSKCKRSSSSTSTSIAHIECVQYEIEGAEAAGEEHMKDLSSPPQPLVAQRSDKA